MISRSGNDHQRPKDHAGPRRCEHCQLLQSERGLCLYPGTLFCHFYDNSYEELNIHKERETICDGNCQYSQTSHYHDLLDMARFDFFITEQGIREKEEYMAGYGGNGRSYRDQKLVIVA